MARAQYFVVLHEGTWKITYEGKHYGPYNSQKSAIDAATAAGRKAVALGRDAQVLVQGADNRFRTEWTYGNDPYPPRG